MQLLGCKAIEQPATQMIDLVGPLYLQEVDNALKACRGVVQQYRRTNKQPPSQPSAYVRDIFAPLLSLQQQHASKDLMIGITTAIQDE